MSLLLRGIREILKDQGELDMRKLLLGSISLGVILFLGFGTNAQAADCSRETDLNGDGSVDALDVAILQSSLGKSEGDEGYLAIADLDGTGTVTTADYGLLLSCS
jgi:hypothetical protein